MYSNDQKTESILEFDLQDFDAVPAGQHIGLFKDVQKTHHQEFGDGVMFVFEIVHGPHKGQTVTRIGKPQATKSNATGKMISGITGSFQSGQRVDLKPFIGKLYNLLVEPTQGQKTRVSQVWPYEVQSMPSHPVYPGSSPSFTGDIPFA